MRLLACQQSTLGKAQETNQQVWHVRYGSNRRSETHSAVARPTVAGRVRYFSRLQKPKIYSPGYIYKPNVSAGIKGIF